MKRTPSWDEQDSNFPPPSHPVFQGIREQEEKNGNQRPDFGSYRSMERRYGMAGRSNYSRWDGPWSSKRGYKEHDEYEEHESGRIVAQVIGAAVLVLVTYVAFQSSHPLAERAQHVVRTVMTKETDITALSNWMASHLGNANLAIPTSTAGSNTTIEDITYEPPLKDFKVTTPYDAEKHPAVILQTTSAADVKAVTKGQVKEFDKNDKYGIYVIVDHGSAGQTLYGHLESGSVKPGDWVYTGQTIGKTAKKEPSDLYFARFIKNKPVNPQDILTQAGKKP
ncbi:peptidoglycan DD-metalloendopeptidase family protein [Effusibacillus consociatus]|uniref:Peptidoglycan DD-metalloendopeptidase family protein n=1 Tax=Effusibacillus consociatus TaxID=1117041 RepID=A0ABV9Q3S3_9BACL